jgi:hypothetical protein
MKKHTLRFTILSILLAVVLSACGAVQAVVPQEVSGLLNNAPDVLNQAQPENANAPQNIAHSDASTANQAPPARRCPAGSVLAL